MTTQFRHRRKVIREIPAACAVEHRAAVLLVNVEIQYLRCREIEDQSAVSDVQRIVGVQVKTVSLYLTDIDELRVNLA